MATLSERIDGALRAVINPRLRQDVVTAEMVRDVATTTDGKVRLTLLLAANDDATLVRAVRQAVEQLEGVSDVRVDPKDPAEFAPKARPAGGGGSGRALPVMDASPGQWTRR